MATRKKYCINIEIEENGSTGFIMGISVPKKTIDGLKGLGTKKEALLKRLLREVFIEVAQERKL